ncbi:MAG: hypothetical protein ACRD2E_11535 [Terriglobales bacterium]
MNHYEIALIGYFVFSAIVSGMPEPDEKSGTGYLWAYRTLHVLSGDFSQWIASRNQVK